MSCSSADVDVRPIVQRLLGASTTTLPPPSTTMPCPRVVAALARLCGTLAELKLCFCPPLGDAAALALEARFGELGHALVLDVSGSGVTDVGGEALLRCRDLVARPPREEVTTVLLYGCPRLSHGVRAALRSPAPGRRLATALEP